MLVVTDGLVLQGHAHIAQRFCRVESEPSACKALNFLSNPMFWNHHHHQIKPLITITCLILSGCFPFPSLTLHSRATTLSPPHLPYLSSLFPVFYGALKAVFLHLFTTLVTFPPTFLWLLLSDDLPIISYCGLMEFSGAYSSQMRNAAFIHSGFLGRYFYTKSLPFFFFFYCIDTHLCPLSQMEHHLCRKQGLC